MNDRRLEKTVELDATPEQVWDAIATGPGIWSWFVPHEVEPREGGAIGQRFGSGFDTTGRVTAWEPGRRFAYGAAEGDPATHAYEFLIEGRDGGGTVLRFVQTGFSDEGWEEEYRPVLHSAWGSRVIRPSTARSRCARTGPNRSPARSTWRARSSSACARPTACTASEPRGKPGAASAPTTTSTASPSTRRH